MKRIVMIFCISMLGFIAGCAGSAAPTGKGDFYVSAWYATYDAARGLQSFLDNIRLFNEINPVWYNLNPAYFTTGTSPFVAGLQNQANVLALARINGVKVLPTIQNFGATDFDSTIISTIINVPTTRSRHVTEILNMVLSENYDGIDIDYENLPASDRAVFSAFISELGTALRQHQKLLSVTVYAKTSANANWAGPGSQDWQSIASSADSMKIMAYDYHWATFHAGPISPSDWLRDILNYARTIPEVKGKGIIGFPLYGLDWGGNVSAKEVMYTDVRRILSQNAAKNYNRSNVDHSTNPICGSYFANVELHFEYSYSGISHTVYFQDSEATRVRLAVINQYRDVVKGVTFWRLGGEDPGVWRELSNYK